MPEQGTNGGPVDVGELSALLNRMLRELVITPFLIPTQDKDNPMIYSFTIKVNNKGIEVMDSRQRSGDQIPQPKVEEREPLIDVIDNQADITVIAELPGVNKNDISILADSKKVAIKAEGSGRSYSKSVELPSTVTPKAAQAVYNNGIIEIVLNKSSSYKEGEIKINVK